MKSVFGGVPSYFDGNGVLRVGTRKFTPQELVRYRKNMYGKNTYKLQSLKYWKSVPQSRRDEQAELANQMRHTAEEIYGSKWKDILRRSGMIVKQWSIDNYEEWHEAVKRNSWKISRALRGKTKNIHGSPGKRHYFLCDATVNGHNYRELDFIFSDNQDFETADNMMLLATRGELDEGAVKELQRRYSREYEKRRVRPPDAKERHRLASKRYYEQNKERLNRESLERYYKNKKTYN